MMLVGNSAFRVRIKNNLFVCAAGNGLTGQSGSLIQGCALALRAKAGPMISAPSCQSREWDRIYIVSVVILF